MKSPPWLTGSWSAYAAAAWAAVFAVFHIIWAAGWYPLLDAEQAREAFAVFWKWAYDVVVAGICIIAVPVTLAPVRPWGRRVPRRLVTSLAYIGTTLLALRSIAALIQTAYFIATNRFGISTLGVWDWWFHLGTILFVLSSLRLRTWRQDPTARTTSAAVAGSA